MIRRKTGDYPLNYMDGTEVYSGSGTTATDYGLTNGITYYYSIFTYDKVPNYSTSTQGSAIPQDTLPPASPSNLTAVAGDGQVSLSWTSPTDTDFAGVKVIRKTGGYPASVTDGTEVYSGAGASATNTGLANGTTYYYSVFAYDEVPNYSSAGQASATPQASSTGSGGGGGGGGCFIATAAYGTPMAAEVVCLSKFRDEYLITNSIGRRLVSMYYHYGPDCARWISDNRLLKSVVRGGLKPLVWLSKYLVKEN